MWLSSKMRPAPATADADLGVTTIAGDSVGVMTRGEVRTVPIYGPGGLFRLSASLRQSGRRYRRPDWRISLFPHWWNLPHPRGPSAGPPILYSFVYLHIVMALPAAKSAKITPKIQIPMPATSRLLSMLWLRW